MRSARVKTHRGGEAGALGAAARWDRFGRRVGQLPFRGALPQRVMRGASWPCCEGCRAGAQDSFPPVKADRGLVLLWLLDQEGAGSYPTRPKTKGQ